MNTLRHSSIIEQLRNDQFAVEESHAPAERMFRYGHNTACQLQIAWIEYGGEGIEPTLRELDGDGNYIKGRNHGTRHVRDVLRTAAALRELADAPLIRTVDLGQEKP